MGRNKVKKVEPPVTAKPVWCTPCGRNRGLDCGKCIARARPDLKLGFTRDTNGRPKGVNAQSFKNVIRPKKLVVT